MYFFNHCISNITQMVRVQAFVVDVRISYLLFATYMCIGRQSLVTALRDCVSTSGMTYWSWITWATGAHNSACSSPILKTNILPTRPSRPRSVICKPFTRLAPSPVSDLQGFYKVISHGCFAYNDLLSVTTCTVYNYAVAMCDCILFLATTPIPHQLQIWKRLQFTFNVWFVTSGFK